MGFHAFEVPQVNFPLCFSSGVQLFFAFKREGEYNLKFCEVLSLSLVLFVTIVLQPYITNFSQFYYFITKSVLLRRLTQTIQQQVK